MTGKTALNKQTFVGKWCLCYLICCVGLSYVFFPRSKRLLTSWLQSPSTVILEIMNIWFLLLLFLPSLCHEMMGTDAMINLVFLTLSFKPAFLLSSFTLIKKPLSSSSLSVIRVVSCVFLRLLIMSSSSLDSHLWFIQSCISNDVLCIEIK